MAIVFHGDVTLVGDDFEAGGSEAIAADERGWAADLPEVTGALELRHGSRLPRGGYLRCGHWADL